MIQISTLKLKEEFRQRIALIYQGFVNSFGLTMYNIYS